jgi:hypothetical protein
METVFLYFGLHSICLWLEGERNQIGEETIFAAENDKLTG